MKTETRIRIAAAIALATALWTILPDWQSHVFLFHGLSDYAQIAGLGITMSVVLLELVLLVHLVAAIALFRGFRWVWVLLVVTLSVQVMLTSFTAVRFAFFPPPPPPPLEGDVVVMHFSLWPKYTRAVLNALAVLILYSTGVRHFPRQPKESHNQQVEAISG